MNSPHVSDAYELSICRRKLSLSYTSLQSYPFLGAITGDIMKKLLAAIALLFGASALAGCLSVDRIARSQPLAFSCKTLDRYSVDAETFLFSELRAFAQPPEEQALSLMQSRELISPFVSPGVKREKSLGRGQQILVLSGGGQWGAYGAGFLSQERTRADWDLVTGISTGALQALFVGASEYEGLAAAYDIGDESDLATKNRLFAFLETGSQYSTLALRGRVMETLLDADRGNLLERIAHGDGPPVEIGIVHAGTGDFVIVRVTDMIRDLYPSEGASDFAARRNALAECVTGVALASSAVPLQLTPVQIDGETYLDGGVRASVFASSLSSRAQLGYALSVSSAAGRDPQGYGVDGRGLATRVPAGVEPPQFYVIRNGPTVVPEDDRKGEKPVLANGEKDPRPFLVDENPSAYRTALRGYATLVNQNELTSIATLLLEYPQAPLLFTSADGYDWQKSSACPERPKDAYFAPEFMRCLLAWGRERAIGEAPGSGWREVSGPATCRRRNNDLAAACLPDPKAAAEAEAILRASPELFDPVI